MKGKTMNRQRPSKKLRNEKVTQVSVSTISQLEGCFPTPPAETPDNHYVYLIYLTNVALGSKTLRYVGKGVGARAWEHQRAILRVLRLLLRGEPITDEPALYRTFLSLFLQSGFRLNLEVEIISQGLSEEDAFTLEKSLIAITGRVVTGNGTLFNLADGGKGIGVKYHEAIASIKNFGVTLYNQDDRKKRNADRIFLRHACNMNLMNTPKNVL